MPAQPAPASLPTTVPRYTSYPTAPQFHAGVTDETVLGWLEGIVPGERLSLYLHIPYCERLCWFCACHTRQTLRYEPVEAYLRSLIAEIRLVGARLGGRGMVGDIHWGGGSPTILKPEHMRALQRAIADHVTCAPECRLGVEIEPSTIDAARLDALSELGLRRASIGIQDFDPRVQAAINRPQSFETTAAVVEGLRARGVPSVNFDLVYGLPLQTEASLRDTIRRALTLAPERIALFGYAHVPWFKKHQTMIDAASLPGPEARLALVREAEAMIAAAGYQPVGIDHFALPCDSLARAAREGRLGRNFQGYTDDACRTLIGLGASSVSRFALGYAQNVTTQGDYARRIAEGRLGTAKGVALSAEDRLRAYVIERLMCDFSFSPADLRRRFGAIAEPVLALASLLAQSDGGLEAADGRFRLTGDPRRMARLVAAQFDAYREGSATRHSLAV
ncbi:oxygen-independent coproporphyrinogen III oxidase [Rhizobium sp. YIM 134829]|uniref:oxygen-independent coproporphyrinogen III oxidase n=1 Tax=Rhizobium sp. YIM 134829 TaxID=3390453 RepID=UPI00397ADCC0